MPSSLASIFAKWNRRIFRPASAKRSSRATPGVLPGGRTAIDVTAAPVAGGPEPRPLVVASPPPPRPSGIVGPVAGASGTPPSVPDERRRPRGPRRDRERPSRACARRRPGARERTRASRSPRRASGDHRPLQLGALLVRDGRVHLDRRRQRRRARTRPRRAARPRAPRTGRARARPRGPRRRRARSRSGWSRPSPRRTAGAGRASPSPRAPEPRACVATASRAGLAGQSVGSSESVAVDSSSVRRCTAPIRAVGVFTVTRTPSGRCRIRAATPAGRKAAVRRVHVPVADPHLLDLAVGQRTRPSAAYASTASIPSGATSRYFSSISTGAAASAICACPSHGRARPCRGPPCRAQAYSLPDQARGSIDRGPTPLPAPPARPRRPRRSPTSPAA